jgi:serine protease Do
MRRYGLAYGLGMLATAVGVGAATSLVRFPGAAAQSAPAAVTPKMQAPPEARSLSRAFSSVAKALRPSVVRIDVEIAQQPRISRNGRSEARPRNGEPDMRDFFERFFEDGEGAPFPQQPGPGRGTGSGVLLDTAGDILTNSHVVAKATKVTVIFQDGREFPARVVGNDDHTDVAVVRLEKPPQGLIAARIGDSEKVEIGEWVLAVGSPLGMDQTVTAGIISSRGKLGHNPTMRMSGAKVREYIQTDAKINPGNSGGPLVNLEGEVIGINTLINTGPGGAYGFAIPINQAQRVAQALVKDGRMRYAFLGVQVADLRDAPAEQKKTLPGNAPENAALVSGVTPNSPAQKAGVRAGDIITRLDDHRIEGSSDVVEYVSQKPIGAKVAVAFLRDGKAGTLNVTLGEFPSDPDALARAEVQKEAIGVQLQDVTPDIAQFLGLPDGTKGAVITEVLPGSRAAKAGLQADDVILEVNRKSVASGQEVAAALKASSGPQVLRVRHAGATRLVTIPAP